ncbi:MAG TPA: hypothetical protein VEZ40_10450, partial [Pyrinomonadaceae bacterium]|nr:hypothetical protein [Pyrinomonadaceae bacterium]
MITAARRALLACAVFVALNCCAFAQTNASAAAVIPPDANAPPQAPAAPQTRDDASLDDVRRQLQQQQIEIERLRATLAEQSKLLSELLARTARPETGAATVSEAIYS